MFSGGFYEVCANNGAMSALVAIIGLENTKAQSQNLFDGFNLVDQGEHPQAERPS